MAATNEHNSHGAAAHADHGNGHIGKGTYYRIFIALMVLMALTVAAWWVEPILNLEASLGPSGARMIGVAVAMAIAIAKTTLIVLYFMHVKVSERVTQLYAAAAFVTFAILVIITMGDYFARGWPPPGGPLP
jgi:cytochrome c oxidase subunit IV